MSQLKQPVGITTEIVIDDNAHSGRYRGQPLRLTKEVKRDKQAEYKGQPVVPVLVSDLSEH
ncbi:hypothetical protein GCM10027341_15250 [Spirosoma knui]